MASSSAFVVGSGWVGKGAPTGCELRTSASELLLWGRHTSIRMLVPSLRMVVHRTRV